MENKNYVFILGPHKSGSSLLRSLLDGHPNLFVIPIETHYFSLSKRFWVNYPFWSQKAESKKSDPKDFIQHVSNYVNNSSKYRDVQKADFIDLEKFKTRLVENWPDLNQTKEEVVNYFDSIYYSMFSKPIDKDLIVVEKSVSNAENAIRFKNLFPGAKFIHIIRNPYANLLSFRNYRIKMDNKFPSLRYLIECLKVNYYYMYKNQEIIDNYCIVKYEDLVSNTSSEMQKIADYLEIPFNDDLLLPTSNGAKWIGNSTSDKNFGGVSSERTEGFASALTQVEVKIVNQLFDTVLRDYGYERLNKAESFFKFGRKETLKRYIYNRLYYYFI